MMYSVYLMYKTASNQCIQNTLLIHRAVLKEMPYSAKKHTEYGKYINFRVRLSSSQDSVQGRSCAAIGCEAVLPNRECSRNDCRNDAFDSNARYGNECQKCLCVTSGRSNKTKASLFRKENCLSKKEVSAALSVRATFIITTADLLQKMLTRAEFRTTLQLSARMLNLYIMNCLMKHLLNTTPSRNARTELLKTITTISGTADRKRSFTRSYSRLEIRMIHPVVLIYPKEQPKL